MAGMTSTNISQSRDVFEDLGAALDDLGERGIARTFHTCETRNGLRLTWTGGWRATAEIVDVLRHHGLTISCDGGRVLIAVTDDQRARMDAAEQAAFQAAMARWDHSEDS